jgi:hypothetical protein
MRRKIPAITGSDRQHLVAQPGDPWQVDAVPIHRWRLCDAVEATVEAGAEINDDRVGVPFNEVAHPVVEHLRAQRRLAHHGGLHTEDRS